jgi:hypothetical protein
LLGRLQAEAMAKWLPPHGYIASFGYLESLDALKRLVEPEIPG